jgi:two-component system, OmpR family, sensor histidine kinase VicK
MVQATEAMQPMAKRHGIVFATQTADIDLWVDSDYVVQALTH